MTVRDSAGVTIVEDSGSAWEPSDAWRLSAEPVVRIGKVEGAEEYLLLAPYGALRLGDGTIAVANSGSGEIRFFDAQGQYLRAAGGRGGGPGEFGNLLWLYPLGEDSIVAWDESPPAVEIFDRDGTFGRSVRTTGFGVLRGVFADGSMLFVGRQQRSQRTTEGRIRERMQAVRLSPEGEILDSLRAFPGTEYDVRTFRGGVGVMPPVFGRETVFAVAGNGFFAGNQDEAELANYDMHGALRTIVRWSSPERAVAPELIETHRRHRLEQTRSANARRLVLDYLERQVYPELLPAFGAIQVDGAGNLWVQEYHLAWEDTQRWIVFDPNYRLLGRVVMPGRLVVHQVGEGFVLGYTWDDLDVEYVEVYRLIKPQEGDPEKRGHDRTQM